LANWPIKLELASPSAPSLKVPELALAADCVGFAYPGFRDSLGEKPVLIGCPKLHSEAYLDRLAAVFGANPGLRKITVAMMALPCCQGLKWYALEALKRVGRDVAVESVSVTPGGEVSPAMEG
jgi:hypothetical protein